MQGTLIDAINYASQNPNSDFANQLGQFIASGQADEQAKKYGVDLTPIKVKYGQPKAPPPPPEPPSIAPTLANKGSTGNPIPEFAKPATEIASSVATNTKDTARKVLEDFKASMSGGVGNFISKGIDAATNIAGGVVKDAGTVIDKGVVQPLAKINADYNPVVKAAAAHSGALLDNLDHGSQYLSDKWDQFKGAYPEIAKKIEGAGNIAQFMTLFIPDPAAKEFGPKLGEIKDNVIQNVSDTVSGAKNAIKSVKERVLPTPNDLRTTIEAVTPDLTGKKLTTAYKSTVTGNRDIVPASIFKEQGLTPDQQSINLGTRFQTEIPDVGKISLGKDPVQNLDTLGSSLEKTEAKIDTVLDGDPEVAYNGDKTTLGTSLDSVKSKIPREFESIKDSKTVFNNVVEFAKETLNKSEDSIRGLRRGRSAFDAQAKIEYPSAFKEGGSIDTKTPAGRAIKTVRDTWNEHIYNTAPNGSELQTLIGREADIFRATDGIASKASKGEGKSTFVKWIQDNPKKATALGIGLSGVLGTGVVGGVKSLLH